MRTRSSWISRLLSLAAAVVCLRFDTEKWEDVKRANAEFYFYDCPRNLD